MIDTIDNPIPNNGDQFGSAVSIVSKKIIVGGKGDRVGSILKAGVAYVIDGDSSSGTYLSVLKQIDNPAPADSDSFGSAALGE